MQINAPLVLLTEGLELRQRRHRFLEVHNKPRLCDTAGTSLSLVGYVVTCSPHLVYGFDGT
jgi:hypothetical protein